MYTRGDGCASEEKHETANETLFHVSINSRFECGTIERSIYGDRLVRLRFRRSHGVSWVYSHDRALNSRFSVLFSTFSVRCCEQHKKRDTNRNMKKKNLDNIRVDQVEATGTRNGPKMRKHTHLYRAYLLIL